MLTVTRSRVKEKCAISDTTRDATIDNLILEFVPVVEEAITAEQFALRPSTMNLAATEIVAGELLAQLGREVGGVEALEVGGIRLRGLEPQDPSGLIARGWARIASFVSLTAREQTGGVVGSVAVSE